jgi:hypothetical protein
MARGKTAQNGNQKTNGTPDQQAFEQGRYGGQNRSDDAYSYQPTPDKLAEMGYNGRGMGAQSEDMAQQSAQAPQSDQQYAQSMDADQQTVQIKQQVIGTRQIKNAREILQKYKSGRQHLEDRIVKNELWWKKRHWQLLRNKDNTDDPKPASGWLFNTIISKHADFMDNFPDSDILPREPGDVEEATRLSSIIPVVMDQVGYRNVFSDEVWYKLKHGTGVFGVYWDSTALNGLGDISIKNVDLLSIFWEPGITDIQKSRNVFTVELVDNDVLAEQYPEVKDKLKGAGASNVRKQYIYDDKVDTTGKSAVIDWYYKQGGKLHYVKFVDEIVLYATENDTERPQAQRVVADPYTGEPVVERYDSGLSMAERGLYDHGKYPFVFDTLFPETGMLAGFGFVDICKDAQMSIDVYNNCFEKNVQYMTSPRYFIRNDGGINEEEFANPHNLLIHTDTNLGQDSVRVVDTPNLINSNYISILEYKITEMKETAGNRDATNGGTSTGVTAASAIAAMQESSGKTSRDQINTTFEAHKQVVSFVIELIRQFYDMPRQFRIVGEGGQAQFTEYSNAGLQPQEQGSEFGVDMGYRLPVFDVKVEAEKSSSYSRLSQNEMALQFYNAGFFNPQYADQALACIGMMDFQGKTEISQKIENNGTMYQQLLQMQQQMLQMAEMVEQLGGQQGFADSMAQQINASLDSQGGNNAAISKLAVDNTKTSTGTSGENAITKNAREQAAERTNPS